MMRVRSDLFRTLEAGTVGLFLVQAARFLYATLYARASSADLVGRVPDPSTLAGVPGVVELATVQTEIVMLLGLLLLPLLALILGRWGLSFPFTVLFVALGRSLALQSSALQVPGAALVIGAGLLYLALTAIRRPAFFPSALLLGVAGDQLIRAAYDSYDHTWQNAYPVNLGALGTVEMGLVIALATILLIVLAIVAWFVERRAELLAAEAEETPRSPYATAERPTPRPQRRGYMSAWGGLALGGVLYLELTLFGLPNAVARWANVDYAALTPWLLGATLLPLVPEVREQARRFAGMFDSAWRGWLWMLLLGLLLVIGRRYEGILAGAVLVFAQFMVGLSLWWLVRTRETRHNLTGITILLGVIAYAALAVGDYFTYDYAYVRDMAAPYQNVSEVLRSFRGMGLGLTLIATLLLALPMILTRRGIAWSGGRALYSFFGLVLAVGVALGSGALSTRAFVRRPLDPNCLRVATLNIHGGYSQFFDPNLERVAQLIQLNGADVVLLQEVDTGRMASFGVDQALWLARQLEMEHVFFPQNEALQGLAVLSRVPIEGMEGLLLPSTGNQAAAMHVWLDPERLVADPEAAELGYLHVYNAWLGFRKVQVNGQPVPENLQDQNIQFDTLLRWVAAQHGPDWTDRIILGGTFNFGPDSPLYLKLGQSLLRDPFAGLRVEDSMTVFLVNGTAARYDYLWTANLPLNSAGIDHSPEAANTSDHRSAIVEVSRREGVQCAP